MWLNREAMGILIYVIILQLTAASSSPQLTGQVTAESGDPLSGATVCVTSWSCSTTDSQGFFKVETNKWPWRGIVHFSCAGFQPATKVIENPATSVNVKLQKGNAGQWNLSPCPPDRKDRLGKKGQYIGGMLKVFVPKGTKIIDKGMDVDYWTIYVGYGPKANREWLQIGGGPSWSNGFPNAITLQSLTEISERDLVQKTDSSSTEKFPMIDGVDIRGQRKNERRYRLTGQAFQTINYDGVSNGAACFFDSIIDTLCYVERSHSKRK